MILCHVMNLFAIDSKNNYLTNLLGPSLGVTLVLLVMVPVIIIAVASTTKKCNYYLTII